jgi:hypothetical protein
MSIFSDVRVQYESRVGNMTPSPTPQLLSIGKLWRVGVKSFRSSFRENEMWIWYEIIRDENLGQLYTSRTPTLSFMPYLALILPRVLRPSADFNYATVLRSILAGPEIDIF